VTLSDITFRDEIDSFGIDVGTVRQWREAGLGTAKLRSLVRAGELKRYRQGVYVRAAYLAAAIASQTTRKAAASHKVVHFTWGELLNQRERVIARVRTAFTASTPY
jgi:hypothetical protein